MKGVKERVRLVKEEGGGTEASSNLLALEWGGRLLLRAHKFTVRPHLAEGARQVELQLVRLQPIAAQL